MNIQISDNYYRRVNNFIKHWNMGKECARICYVDMNECIRISIKDGAKNLRVAGHLFYHQVKDHTKGFSISNIYKNLDPENRELLQKNPFSIENGLLQNNDIKLLKKLDKWKVIRPFDVWNFGALDPEYGLPYPGQIPADLLFNALYFFTEQSDLVIDPMAGGGVVGDVCNAFNRKCLMYDINPIRPDITKYSVLSGIPKEAERANLLFWDPPYYKKKEVEYGHESISALEKEQYLQAFEYVGKSAYDAGIKKIALLISDYDDVYNNNYEDNILVWDYVNRFPANKWYAHRHIHCDLSTQQINKAQMKPYKENKKLHRLTRSLIIFFRK